MPVAAYTNFDISNVYKGNNNVSRIMKGNNHVWPTAPVFSFDTYQSGGDLNFTVTSDTGIIATVVNGNESMLHPVTRSINLIRTATASRSYNESYTTPPDTQLTDINLPLYRRREVTVTGRGTQRGRYGHDYNTGSVNVWVSNDYLDAVTFSVNINGSSKTKTIAGQSAINISFTGLSKGNKSLTITNVTDNTSEQISVNINTNYTPLTPIYYRFGAQDNLPTVSEKLTRVDVYALTEAEALASNSSFTPRSRAAVIQGSNFKATVPFFDCFTVYTFSATYTLIDRGSGYPKNTTITADTGLPGWFSGVKTEFQTDHNGSVYRFRIFQPGGGWNVSGSWTPWYTSSGRYYNRVVIIGFYSFKIYPNFPSAAETVNLYNLPPPPPARSVPAENLLFNNTDSQGGLVSVNTNGIAVNSITVQSQKDLQIIQTSSTDTYPDIKISKPDILKVSASPKLQAMHGAGVTYDYINGSWPVGFNPLLYMQFYSDLMSAYGPSNFEGAWYHYKTWGVQNGRTHSTDFLAQDYLDLHADLRAAFGSTGGAARLSAMLHWFSDGIAEGRQGRK